MLNELGADALLLLNESNMHYFCGFSPSEGAILIFKNGEAAQTAVGYRKKDEIEELLK